MGSIMVRVTGDAHITRVLGMGMPISLSQRPGFHKLRALCSLQLFLEHSLAIKFNILRVVTLRLKWGKNGQGYVILSPFNSLTYSPMNRRYGSTSLIPVIPSSVLTVKDNFGLCQTSNFSWDEPNSNLGRPKLSQRSPVWSESNLGRVEPINWIRSVINFLPNKAKYTLSDKFFIY